MRFTQSGLQKGLECLGFASALGAAACGGSVQRQVKGATFALSSKEIGLASEYERGEPQTTDAQVLCDYWTKRRADADGNHLVGIFSWPPEYFVHLRAWADAKKSGVCEVAKAESDARDAKRNEAERTSALADAEREHEARDVRAWAEAAPGDCEGAAKESACDGVRAYLAIAPNGHHVAEATSALKVGEPKMAELRRQREEAATRKASEASKLEEAAGFRVSSLRASIDDAPTSSGTTGELLRVAFDLTAIRPLARGVTPIVRAACQVGEKRMVDVAAGLDAHLDDLTAGDTKAIEASAYAKRALQAAPSQCEIVVLRGAGGETTGTVVHTFCFVPGQAGDAVKEGPCSAVVSAPARP